MRALPRTVRLGAAIAAAGLVSAAPAGASATFGCSASAARISVLGAPSIEPTTANQGNPACATATSTLANPLSALGLPLSASAVAATTQLDAAAQTVTSAGGIADLKVLALPTIPGLNIDQITAPLKNTADVAVNAVNITLPSAVTTALGTLSLPTTVAADATQAVQNLVPTVRALASTNLLELKTAMAYSAVACSNGQPVVAGTSQLAGLTIAGQELPTNAAVSKTVSLLPAVSVDFSKASASAVTLTPNVATLLASGLVAQPVKDALTDAINTQVAGFLAALPTVTVPALNATVAFAPGQTIRNGDSVTQQAAAITASVAGIKLAEGVIGEATASESGLDCSAVASPNTPTGATLQCTSRKLVLVDVLEHGDRVKLTGVADPKYIGKSVSIVFGATGQTVAHAIVAKDGSFETTAPLPAARLRDTNRARYTAKVGHERSLDLKLRRRMIVRSMSSRQGKVTISGRVVPPLGRPVAPIVLTQRVSCAHEKVVRRFRPDAHGNFRITIPAPRKGGTAVYRLSTFVRPSARSHRLAPTFTLPRAVELRR